MSGIGGRYRRACCTLLVLLVSARSAAFAHEIRPAYLALRQAGPDLYDVLWKVPGLGNNARLAITVNLPPSCVNVTEPRTSRSNGAVIERWTVRCAGTLDGARIHVAGLKATQTDVLVRLQRLDGTLYVTRLMPASDSFVVQALPGSWQLARSYGQLGIEHILFGADHLLFVLGLVLLVRGTIPLLKTITAFTIAHSITLSLAVLGVVHVPSPPVEATIALSILFVGIELVKQVRGKPGLAQQRPWLVAGAFGLLHGLGFAGALARIGIPQGEIPIALLTFNIGVEVGQLAFVAVVLVLIQRLRKLDVQWPSWTPLIPGYVIGSVAAFWLLDRVTAFL